jgi:hypothetical protein
MAHVQEFTPATEAVTATIVSPLGTGEAFGTPITLGYYPGTTEIWIEAEGQRFNVQSADVPVLIKQLKRVVLLAPQADGEKGE